MRDRRDPVRYRLVALVAFADTCARIVPLQGPTATGAPPGSG